MSAGRSGCQLSDVLTALGGGRAPLPVVPDAPPGALGSVRRAVRALAVLPPVQTSATTCGAACLAVVAAAGDERVLRWVLDGTGADDQLRGASDGRSADGRAADDRAAVVPSTPAGRFAALQLRAHRASTRTALGGLPWPRSLGTPPWGAAGAARFAGLAFTHRVLADARPQQSRPLLDVAVHAARQGLPVLLYTGGDTSAGLSTAVPRHVVLLSSPDGRALEVYEPGSGRLHPTSPEALAEGGTRRPAYGGWSHLTWVVLPGR